MLLLKKVKGEEISPIKVGKGKRRRINNTKYFEESDEESEEARVRVLKDTSSFFATKRCFFIMFGMNDCDNTVNIFVLFTSRYL